MGVILYDILATTSNKVMINGVYTEELPVVYDPPKPKKIIFTEDDLYQSDLFSFGSIIGSITNKGSIAYSMLPNIINEYGVDSLEYKLTISRLKQCCKAQNAQIDKTKIGKAVKGIPKVWIDKQDDPVLNNILLNKYPYFFKYRYNTAKTAYNKYVDENNITCYQKFGVDVKTLLKYDTLNDSQEEFLRCYYKYMPLVISDSPMNMLCRHIEEVNFKINQKIKTDSDADLCDIYKNKEHEYSDNDYKRIINVLEKHLKSSSTDSQFKEYDNSLSFSSDVYNEYVNGCDLLREKLCNECSDMYVVTNCLVDYYYVQRPKANKDLMWDVVGSYIYSNIYKSSNKQIMFPFEDNNGDILYLNKRYSMRCVELNDKE